MKNSFTTTNSMRLRASSAKPKITETPINMAKREKLKQLIIEKLIKKLSVPTNYRSFIDKEVTSFISKEKLTEDDLKELEDKIKKSLQEKSSTEKLKNHLTQGKENEMQTPKSEKFDHVSLISDKLNDGVDDNKSVSNYSNASNFSKKLTIFDNLKYEEINDFQLRKLLKNEKKPINEINSNNLVPDDWTSITKYKAKKLEELEKQNKILERNKKLEQRDIYNKQMKEKEISKNQQDLVEKKYHYNLLDNVERLNQLEKKKREEELEKKKLEKQIREQQIQEKIERKLSDFSSNRNYDKKLIDTIITKNEVEKKKEIQKHEEAKNNLCRMLKDNQEFKKRQSEKLHQEREEDIKAMEEYSKILDKQEKDRIAYFKKCESRQLEAMNRMAENVVKKENEKLKQEEEKVKKYQTDKDRRDQEEEEKRKKYIKDSKSKMREYLLNQMNEKKEVNKIEKIVDNEQVDIWNRENKNYFENQREIHHKVKNNTKLYAEFLKSQMIDRKKSIDIMNEEEIKLNREIINEMVSKTPSVTKRNFLI